MTVDEPDHGRDARPVPRADLRSQPRSSVLPRGVRTYKPRRSRPTVRASRALARGSAFLLSSGDVPLDLDAVFGAGVPVVVELGFGDGAATAALAASEPAVGVLAVDVHTPGVGELLARIDEAGLVNVRVVEGDGLAVLDRMVPPASLTGLRTFFPDPWPKARHHKRRLVQPAVAALVRDRLVPGGWWHLATDWPEYAEAMVACLDTSDGWTGGVVARPPERPVTRFERRALAAGRPVTDLVYRTRD